MRCRDLFAPWKQEEAINVKFFCSRNTHEIEQTLKDMDVKYEYFLLQYRRGFEDTREVVVKKLQELDRIVTTVAEDTQKIINSHVTKEVSVSMTFVQNQLDNREGDSTVKARREKFLASLKFVGMNERASNISQVHTHTFGWLFGEQRSSSRSNPEVSETSSDRGQDSAQIEISKSPKSVPWDSFTEWLQSNNEMYCIIGKPGAGKSTLMRYIVNNPGTMNLLRRWRGNVAKLSHYFWRLGSVMQQNTRGMLLSLLYQLLVGQADLLEKILVKQALAMKDEPTDWSLQEIKDALDFAILNSETPVCMFLDGLDELDPNEPVSDLFSLLYGWLQRRPGWIKLCISSRPEHVILQNIDICPRLKLEQLTQEDMKEYAHGHLKFPAATDHDDELTAYLSSKDQLVTKLVEKAEGIFLWLYLAIKSLNDGFAREDGLDELRRRIVLLHRGVKNLYMDMRSRQNGNEDVYRRESTLYLCLAIAAISLVYHRHHRINDYVKIPGYVENKHLTILDAVLASEDVTDDILSPLCTEPPDESYLLSLCPKAEKHIRIRCAGLLECCNEGCSAESYNDAQKFYGVFTKYVLTKVKFVHRTAMDFLLETTEGNDILGQDSDVLCPRYRLTKAILAQHRLFSFQPSDELRYRGHSLALWTVLNRIDHLDSPTTQFIERSDEHDRRRCLDQQIDLCIRWDRLYRARQIHPLDWVLPRHLQNDGGLMSLAVRCHCFNYFKYQMESGGCVMSAATRAQLFIDFMSTDQPDLDRVSLSDNQSLHPYLLAETLLCPEMNPNWVSGTCIRLLGSRSQEINHVFQLTTPLTGLLRRCLDYHIDRGTNVFESLWRAVQILAQRGANPDAVMHTTIAITGLLPKRFFYDFDFDHVSWIVAGNLLSSGEGFAVAMLVYNAAAAAEICANVLSRRVACSMDCLVAEYGLTFPKIHWLKNAQPRMRIAAISERGGGKGKLTFQRPSVQDSNALIDIILERRGPGSCSLVKENGSNLRDILDRSPALDCDRFELMERLGFWGRAQLDVSEDVENPWKRSETAFEVLDREDAEAARAEGRTSEADEKGETQ